jgi:hypothetical protein
MHELLELGDPRPFDGALLEDREQIVVLRRTAERSRLSQPSFELGAVPASQLVELTDQRIGYGASTTPCSRMCPSP